ncbi:HlyD family secretion protein [Variovorax sp. OK605]|uniref:HlyD family secretion protein n=1 Tax=Variovorax sp. OK605 TaxID=1855317 RepID=UPI0008F14E6C|nr:HlyD family efflux transporter periplasmic adaptor subunit [Variovorax sp. OK605]SFO53726.1 HlyD family secretion protein [Variovorax sp. OK605]
MNASTVRESDELAHAEATGWFRRLRRKNGKGPAPKESGESLVPRLAGYALLAFVLWLVITTLIQPLVSRQATRTVLQAPVLLVTSPISGVVTRMTVRASDKVEAGAVVATVQNPTINRDILTTLTTQRLALQSQVAQLANQLNASNEELQFVEQQVKLYRTASMAQTRDAWQVAQRQREVALSSVAEQELKVRHTSAMLDEGAVSPQAMDAAQAQLSISRASAAVAEQAYVGLGQSVASASRGVFVGGSGATVYQTLANRRETLAGDIERAQHDSQALQQQLREVAALETDERRRIERMAAFEVRAMQPGQVHTVLMPQGSYVPQGATLVRMIDCSRIEVVAVFPPRVARRLDIGSTIAVKTDDGRPEVSARVTQILPVAPEDFQSRYAVPFPFAEQGSVYAVAHIEAAMPEWLEQRGLCAPGKVVSARLAS